MASTAPARARRRPRPGRPRKLDYEDVIAAAFEVMNDEGFSTLSMRSLAKKLGIAHGNLYTYVGHIEDVEAEVLKRLLERLPAPSTDPAGPAALRAELITFLHATRKVLFQHPHVMYPPIGSPAWVSFGKLTTQWISALARHESDARAVAVGFTALIAHVASHAQRERLVGPDHLARNLQAWRKTFQAHPALVEIERMARHGAEAALTQIFETLIDRLFPALEQTARAPHARRARTGSKS
ncbi:MAG TPA: TetR family transcriptional regulator [Nevskiaceae bacterium]|nr:TetR family transcriptional regulator [Nevskiaceae bacterium]